MSRKEELEKIVFKEGSDNHIKAAKLIDYIIDLENQMDYYMSLPKIKVDKDNPERQKATPAAKLYKEALQQYNNSLRLLFRITGDLGEVEEDSPLRQWCKRREELDI